MAGPLVQALIAHFDSVFIGPNGDYSAVLETVSGLSVAQALWTPEPSQNSIWQIVEHLIASKEWLMEMLEQGQANSPVWTTPSGNEEAWQASVEKLKEAHRRLEQILAKLEDDALLQSPTPEDNHTLLELILSSGAAHEAHHSGQIDYLKGLQSMSNGQ